MPIGCGLTPTKKPIEKKLMIAPLAKFIDWSIIQIGRITPENLRHWHISTKEFREDLQWAVSVPGTGETSPAVVQLLSELSARGITIL